MKKNLSLVLVLVLALSALVVPAGAKTAYTYKSYTVTDMHGDVYTFSAASTGYDLHSMLGDEQTRDILVILKQGSTVTAKDGGKYGLGFLTWGMWGENNMGDVVGMDVGTYGKQAVERIYDFQCKNFGYDIEDTVASLNVGEDTVFFMLESAAERHSNRITLKGAPAPVFKPKQDVSVTFTDVGYNLDNGHGYQYTLKNNTDAPIKKYAALVTYQPDLRRELKYDFDLNRNVEVKDGKQLFRGQLHEVNMDLAAGESATFPMASNFNSLSTYAVLWIDFDSLSERDAFLKDPIFGTLSVDYQLQGYRAIHEETGAAWMSDTLGITINPAK